MLIQQIPFFLCRQDYPSVSQISHKIADRKVNVIFAVTKEKLGVYRKLSEHIEGSAVGELADDSSNIVTLVRENYDVSNWGHASNLIFSLSIIICAYGLIIQ